METELSKKASGDDIEVVLETKQANGTNGSAAVEDGVKSQLDLYNDALFYEETEVSRRSAEADQTQFLDTCRQVRVLMAEIVALKGKQGAKTAEEVEKRRVQIMMLVLNMRKLSRTQKVRVRNGRESSLEERQRVDGGTLQLQGLLYEVLHLHKEAKRCLQAHTADKEIELVPVEQFYAEAPEEIARPSQTRGDPHAQRLARLHHELEQRKQQTTTCESLSQEQLAVERQIEQHRSTLSQLGPRIKNIMQSTLPLQEALRLPLSAMWEQQELSHLLPMPLYTLWMQTSAYSEAGDTLLCSIIRGDKAKAEALEKQPEGASPPDMLEVHPLHVEVTISLEAGSSVVIQFSYAQQLRFITSRCIVVGKDLDLSFKSEVLADADLLSWLFPGDDGLHSPNPATAHQLQRLAPAAAPSTLVPPPLGRAYKWAQQLAGLAFPDPSPGESDMQLKELAADLRAEEATAPVSSERVHVTLAAVRRRLAHRLALHAQLAKLAKAQKTTDIPLAPCPGLFPAAVAAELASFAPVAWADYEAATATAALREAGLVGRHGFPYRAVFRRKCGRKAGAELVGLAWLSPDHPRRVPLWALELRWPGRPVLPAHVQQLEAEVNVWWPELVADGAQAELLPRMLWRLAACLDVYADAQGGADAPSNAFFRPARGPDRAVPLKYLPKLRVFAQR